MPDPQKPTLTRRLSEIEAHQLLARAAELDARLATSVSADQLWSAAREAGISEEALAQATTELDAGKLVSPARGAAIRAFFGTLSRIGIAAVLVYALLASPKFLLPQLIGLAFAVYGAYDGLGRLVRWFGKRRRDVAPQQVERPSGETSGSTDTHTSMAVRTFAARISAHGAA
jgi:hypothetical protein